MQPEPSRLVISQSTGASGGALRRSAASASALNPERNFLLKHIGFDKKIVKAQGSYYFDEDGKSYLNFLAQYGAVPFGHNPSELWDCIHHHGRQQRPSFMQPLVSPAAG